MKITFDVNNVNDLDEIADAIVNQISNSPILSFEGEMGAGKTTLITKVCKKLGVSSHISSPTYAIVNTYNTESQGDVYHFDFYRLEDEQEALESGLDELLDSGNVCLMEWSSIVSKLLPENYVTITISILGPTQRRIEITS